MLADGDRGGGDYKLSGSAARKEPGKSGPGRVSRWLAAALGPALCLQGLCLLYPHGTRGPHGPPGTEPWTRRGHLASRTAALREVEAEGFAPAGSDAGGFRGRVPGRRGRRPMDRLRGAHGCLRSEGVPAPESASRSRELRHTRSPLPFTFLPTGRASHWRARPSEPRRAGLHTWVGKGSGDASFML